MNRLTVLRLNDGIAAAERHIVTALTLLLAIAAGLLPLLSLKAWWLVITAGIILVALLSLPREIRSWPLLSLLFVSSVTLPSHVHLTVVSLNGLFSVGATAINAALLLRVMHGRHTAFRRLEVLGMVTFAWMGAVTLLRGKLGSDTVQNLSVYFVFFSTILLVRIAVTQGLLTTESIDQAFVLSALIGIGLYWLQYLLPMGMLITNRQFALFALPVIAWHAAQWRYGRTTRLLVCLGMTSTIAFSLSRSAFATAAILLLLACIKPSKLQSWIAALAVGALGASGAYLALFRIQAIHDRFFGGYGHIAVGSIQVGDSGRGLLWSVVYQAIVESQVAMVLGRGAGAANSFVTAFPNVYVSRLEHPLNDYLRLWFDFGLIGLTLWSAAFILLFTRALLSWIEEDRGNSSSAAIPLAGVLAIVGMSLPMMTDNVVVYIYDMVPAAVIIGLFLACLHIRSDQVRKPNVSTS